MTTRLVLGKDTNGNVTYTLPTSDTIYGTTLAASTAQSVTVPPNCGVVLYSYSSGSNVYVNASTTAAIPGSSFAKSENELNPLMRFVKPGQTISFFSTAAAYVNCAFYELNYSTGLS